MKDSISHVENGLDYIRNLQSKHNPDVIVNPKFYFILCIQNTLYLRVVELFKDPNTLEISAIPLNVPLKTIESDIFIAG